MSAFSAAAQDEDGDIISALREKLGRAHALCRIRLDRIRELEAMLYAVGAGGVGNVEPSPAVKQSLTDEKPQDHSEQYLGMVPAAWLLRDANNHNVKFLEWTSTPTGYRGEWIKTPLYARPQPPVVEQPQPLTIEQIARIDSATEWPEGSLRNIGPRDWRRLLVTATRAIERAHGIGGEA